MNWKNRLPGWIVPEQIKFAAIIGIALGIFHYGLHQLLQRLRIPEAATLWDDLAIGILGALVSLFYLSATRVNQIYLRAKERMTLTAELNHHVRKSLAAICYAASLEDAGDRIRGVEEAIDHIDRVLTELVPTPGKEEAPRYFLADER